MVLSLGSAVTDKLIVELPLFRSLLRDPSESTEIWSAAVAGPGVLRVFGAGLRRGGDTSEESSSDIAGRGRDNRVLLSSRVVSRIVPSIYRATALGLWPGPLP